MKKIIVLIDYCTNKDNAFTKKDELNFNFIFKDEKNAIIPLEKIVDTLQCIKDKALILTNKLLFCEPYFRGIQQLKIFEKIIFEYLCKIFYAIQLYQFMVNENYSTCEFSEYCWLTDELYKLSLYDRNQISIFYPEKKLEAHTNQLNFFPVCFKELLFFSPKNEINRIIGSFLSVPKSNIWFYITEYFFTKNAFTLEKMTNEKFHFLFDKQNLYALLFLKHNKLMDFFEKKLFQIRQS